MVVVVGALAGAGGCGRFGFDLATETGDGGGPAQPDADPSAPDADPGAPDAGPSGPDAAAGTFTEDFGETPGADHTGVTFDTMVRDWRADENFGGRPELSTEAQGSQNQVLLIRFDLTALPAAATVTAVELRVWTVGGASQTTTGYEIHESWTEGELDGNAGATNWFQRDDSAAWTNPGVGPPSSRGTTPLFSIAPTANGVEYVATVPAALVQAWAANVDSNHGLALVTTSSNEASFHASESATAARRPVLRITYDVP